MTRDTANLLVGEGWRDGIEALVRDRIRGLIEEILEQELEEALGRGRYVRLRPESVLPVEKSEGLGEEVAACAAAVTGYRNGSKSHAGFPTDERPILAPSGTAACTW